MPKKENAHLSHTLKRVEKSFLEWTEIEKSDLEHIRKIADLKNRTTQLLKELKRQVDELR